MFKDYSSQHYKLDFDQVLRKYELSVYEMVQKSIGPDDKPQSILAQLYKLRKDTDRGKSVRLDTLSEIVLALRKATGKEIGIQDILKVN